MWRLALVQNAERLAVERLGGRKSRLPVVKKSQILQRRHEIGMTRRERFLPDSQAPLHQGRSFRILALVDIHLRKIVQPSGEFAASRPQGLLPNRNGLLVKSDSFVEVAFQLSDLGQVVQAGGDMGMFRAQ